MPAFSHSTWCGKAVFLAAVWAVQAASASVDVADLMASRGLKSQSRTSAMVYVYGGSGHRVELMPGSAHVLFDGRFIELPVPLYLRNGRLKAPEALSRAVAHLLTEKPQPQPSGQPIQPRLKRIMIDAGHGGRDPGASGYGLKEKSVALDIALEVGRILKQKGWVVGYTRRSDVFISLDARADVANRFQADVFVSIHANSAASRSAAGFETYYVDNKTDNIERGREAARDYDLRPGAIGMERAPSPPMEAVLRGVLFEEYKHESREMATAIQSAIARVAPSNDRGVKLGPWRVVRKSNCAHCLVEVGFISNAAEAARLARASYRRQLASAIAEGVESLRRRFEQTNGFTR